MRTKKIAAVTSLLVAFTLGGTVGVKADSYIESISAYLDHSISIKVNGEKFKAKDSDGNELEPINYNGSTYLPLRAIAEVSGLPVKWNEETRTASIGYESIQLNNQTKSSFVDIQVSGNWKPSYITNVRKIYSNWFSGVVFEIRSLDGKDFDQTVAAEVDAIKKRTKIIKSEQIEVKQLAGTFVEYEIDAHNKTAYLKSSNSDEYYVVNVFVEKSQYPGHEDIYDHVISTFRKQL